MKPHILMLLLVYVALLAGGGSDAPKPQPEPMVRVRVFQDGHLVDEWDAPGQPPAVEKAE